MSYVVYKHTSPSGKSYIGVTEDYTRRSSQHERCDGNDCPLFYKAIQKYGWDTFTHEILSEGLTLGEANDTEDYFIVHHNTLSPNGYNLKRGGSVNTVCEEVRQRLSQMRKGRPGKPHTEETKKRISNLKKGKPRPPGLIEKIAAARRGKPGKPHTEETKLKKSKQWIVIDPDGTEHRITNLRQWCKDHGLHDPAMILVSQGKQKNHKGWLCVSVDDVQSSS